MPEGQPIVWRGPLVGGAIQQFLRDVDWGELDYLVIDLPPGTSDAQLTLAQAVPISGAVMVTTPQDVALLDVEKALAMFRRMSVPVMGIVENMSAFICPHCGEATEIFGRGGGEQFARRHELEYFGGIPLDVKVRQGGDAGVPAVAQREPGAGAEVLRALARTVAARMSVARSAPTAGIFRSRKGISTRPLRTNHAVLAHFRRNRSDPGARQHAVESVVPRIRGALLLPNQAAGRPTKGCVTL